MSKPRILVIEDDDLQYELYEDALSDYDLVRVRTGSDALEAAAKTSPNAIILDHILDEGDLGLDYLPDEVLEKAHLKPCKDIAATVREKLKGHSPGARVAVLPQGPLTIPYLA